MNIDEKRLFDSNSNSVFLNIGLKPITDSFSQIIACDGITPVS